MLWHSVLTITLPLRPRNGNCVTPCTDSTNFDPPRTTVTFEGVSSALLNLDARKSAGVDFDLLDRRVQLVFHLPHTGVTNGK